MSGHWQPIFTFLRVRAQMIIEKIYDFELDNPRVKVRELAEAAGISLIVFLYWEVPIPAQPRTNIAGQKLAKYDMKFVDLKSNLFRISAARHEYRAVEFEYTTYAVFTIQRLQF